MTRHESGVTMMIVLVVALVLGPLWCSAYSDASAECDKTGGVVVRDVWGMPACIEGHRKNNGAGSE